MLLGDSYKTTKTRRTRSFHLKYILTPRSFHVVILKLSGLCEQEVFDRYQKRVQRWTREAGLPAGKSFANLNLAELGTPMQQQVIALKDQIDWAHHAGNILLIGPSGLANRILPPPSPVS